MKFKLKTKIFTFEHPAFYKGAFHVGLAGNVDSFCVMLDYFANPEEHKKPPRPKGVEGIVLTADGKIFTFVDPSTWLRVHQDMYAIGSGMNFAMGSLTAGATAKEAVQNACKLDPMSGMGVTSIDL